MGGVETYFSILQQVKHADWQKKWNRIFWRLVLPLSSTKDTRYSYITSLAHSRVRQKLITKETRLGEIVMTY
jgi:hypothetical protein